MPDFEEVYRLYFADVYKYILALSRDGAVAEEITQETFFRAIAALRRGSPAGTPPGSSTSCSTPCRNPTRRCSPCGPSGSCPSQTSGCCSRRAKAGPG